MNDENIYGGGPALDDIDYTAPASKNEGPTGVTAPVLDEIEYVAPAAKRGDPTGVSAPVLDDMSSYAPPAGEKKGAPTGVTAPVLDDDTMAYSAPAAAPEKLVLSDEDIINGLSPEQKGVFDTLPASQQQQIIDMRRQQLGAEAPASPVTAPVLDEDNYTPPPKKEEPPKPAEPVSAPILDDEPETPVYKPKFVDEDLERAKNEAKKQAVSSQLVSDQKDKKESLRLMLALKEERRVEMAAKGFKILIVMFIVAIIGSAAFFLLYSGTPLGLDYKNGVEGLAGVISNSALYIAIAMIITAGLMLTGSGGLKSLASFVFVISALIQLFPGLAMIPQHNGSMVLVLILYAVSFISTVAVIVVTSASECVGQYFSKSKQL